MKRSSLIAGTLISVALLASGCSVEGSASDSSEVPVTTNDYYPITLDNCGHELVFDQAPENVVLLESAPVTSLSSIGVLDRSKSRAGAFVPEYYDEETNRIIDSIPVLSEDIDASGHLMLSEEAIIAEQPDLVLGQPDGVTREGLANIGANLVVQEVYCREDTAASFQDIYDQVIFYGEVFNKNDEAEEVVSELEQRLEELEAEANSLSTEGLSAVVLYPTGVGGVLYAYGTGSMAQPQLKIAGLENVYSDMGERVFEVSTEDLVAKDPDVVVLLGDDVDQLKPMFLQMTGVDELSAVQNNRIHSQLFNFTEPASPLVVDGAEKLIDFLSTAQG